MPSLGAARACSGLKPSAVSAVLLQRRFPGAPGELHGPGRGGAAAGRGGLPACWAQGKQTALTALPRDRHPHQNALCAVGISSVKFLGWSYVGIQITTQEPIALFYSEHEDVLGTLQH